MSYFRKITDFLDLKSINLLVSARDPAAAFHMSVICLAARDDPRFHLSIVAQPPALGILRARGLSVLEIPLIRTQALDSPQSIELKAIAEGVLNDIRPEVLLCGLSSPPEGGIDEALILQRHAPAFLMQDFWGEQNKFFGRGVDAFLVLDEAAAQLSRFRHSLPALVTGSPRHSEYRSFDSTKSREQMRKIHHIPDGIPIIGLFGQPLYSRAGYRRTLEIWARSIDQLPFKAVVAYRPHPRELAAGRLWMENWLRDTNISSIVLDSCTTEEALATCDVACTVFSNCAYDCAYLNYFSKYPLVTPVMLLFDKEMVTYYSKLANFNELPYFSQQLVLPVWDEKELVNALIDATYGAARRNVWVAARRTLPDPSCAVAKVLDAVFNTASNPDYLRDINTSFTIC